LCAALLYRWDGKRSRLYFQTQPGSYNDEKLIAFLKDLRRHLRGQKAILIWDGLPAHKSRVMKDYLHQQRRWLQVELLPGYAPDLNPVEALWGVTCRIILQPCVAQPCETGGGASRNAA
jgi:transposase